MKCRYKSEKSERITVPLFIGAAAAGIVFSFILMGESLSGGLTLMAICLTVPLIVILNSGGGYIYADEEKITVTKENRLFGEHTVLSLPYTRIENAETKLAGPPKSKMMTLLSPLMKQDENERRVQLTISISGSESEIVYLSAPLKPEEAHDDARYLEAYSEDPMKLLCDHVRKKAKITGDSDIDGGKAFDWGRTSEDYARYRDIYPEEFYQKILSLDLCTEGQHVLDIGTGTGVIPRNMYRFGAEFVGTDISENQVEQAKKLSEAQGMDIEYLCKATEELDFPEGSFDAVTACQCYFYFDHAVTAPLLAGLLRDGGKLAFLYMGWLPDEDKVAGASEELVLKYNPDWTGGGDKRHRIDVPDVYKKYFNIWHSEVFDVKVPFTRESWNGRIKACRGIGASLEDDKITEFEKEHLALLEKIAEENFEVRHYCAITVMEKK